MLTIKECIELCGIDDDELEAIAEHEHLPLLNAVELASYLVNCDDGIPRIRRIILDDLEQAEQRNDRKAVEKYRAILNHFIATHPEREKFVGGANDRETSNHKE